MQDGESLWSIATQYGIKVKALKEANRQLFNPGARCGTTTPRDDVVMRGDCLNVPVSTASMPLSTKQALQDMQQTRHAVPEIHTEGGDVCEGGNSGEVASSQTQATQACAEASFGMKSIPQLALPPLQLPTAISIQAAGAASVVMAGAVFIHIFRHQLWKDVGPTDSLGEASGSTQVAAAGAALSEGMPVSELSGNAEAVEEVVFTTSPTPTYDMSLVGSVAAPLHKAESVSGVDADDAVLIALQSSDAHPGAVEPVAIDDVSQAGDLGAPPIPCDPVSEGGEHVCEDTGADGSEEAGGAGLLAGIAGKSVQSVSSSDLANEPLNSETVDVASENAFLDKSDAGQRHFSSMESLHPSIDSNDSPEMSTDALVEDEADVPEVVAEAEVATLSEVVPSSHDALSITEHSDAVWPAATTSQSQLLLAEHPVGDAEQQGVTDALSQESDAEHLDSEVAADGPEAPSSSTAGVSSASVDVEYSVVDTLEDTVATENMDISVESWKPKQQTQPDPQATTYHHDSDATATSDASHQDTVGHTDSVDQVHDDGTIKGSEHVEAMGDALHLSAANVPVPGTQDHGGAAVPGSASSKQNSEGGWKATAPAEQQLSSKHSQASSAQSRAQQQPKGSNDNVFDGLSQLVGAVAANTGLLQGSSLLGTVAARGSHQPTMQENDAFTTQADDLEQLEECLWKISKATDKGVTINAEQQGELEELVLKMEALAAADEPKALTGEWKLLLSTDIRTQSVVRAISLIPFVSLGDIVQRVDVQKMEVETRVNVVKPVTIQVSNMGTFKLKSSKRMHAKRYARVITHMETPQLFTGLETPQLFTGLQVPQSVTIGDNSEIDLSGASQTAKMLQTAVLHAIHFATKHEMKVEPSHSSIWLNTVIRDHIRICRGADSEILLFQRC